jgi:putative ABC transport system permease protein
VSLLELLRLAFSRLATSRMRSALTMLGVIIGVASVVALVGIGQGTTSSITARLNGLGTNLLTVTPGASQSGNTRGAQGSATTLTLADASQIKMLNGVSAVAPELSGQGLVTSGTLNTTTTIVGTTPDYASVRAYQVAAGSFLSDLDVERQLRVAVLGATTASDLGLDASSIGSTVQIAGLPFELKGILAAKGTGTFQNQDDEVVVPVTVVQKYLVGTNNVRTVGVSVASQDQMDVATAEITALLRQRHGLAATATDDFSIANQAQLLETANSISGTLTLLLGGIASISLIVGGIGIMNIMLVSVRERTREIGIRKAVGARRRDILAQFLVEALTLSLLGGLVGVAVGLATSAALSRLGGLAIVLNPLTLGVAVGFSALIGVVFGVWPARQAAVLDPIAALRYE